MQCPDCGKLRHHGECQESVTCTECGEEWIGEVGWCPTGLCPECAEFLEDRESRAAMAWYETIEEIDRERTRQDQA